MILTIEQIIQFIKNPQNKEWIERACEIHEQHELHVKGEMDCVLSRVQKIVGIENKDALELRKQLAKPFTMPVLANAMARFKRIFSAKGTVKDYKVSTEQGKQNLIKILEDEGLDEYISQKWATNVENDPNGLIFFEVSKDGARCYPTIIESEALHDIGILNQTRIEYIIFKPVQTEYGKKEYRIIDDSFDYLVIEDKDNYTIDPLRTIPIFEGWGRVPAFINSNRYDIQEFENYNSYIFEAITDLDIYFENATVKAVSVLKSAFPREWSIAVACQVCNGAGVVPTGEVCPSCKGSKNGNKHLDAADVIVFNPEMHEKDPRPAAGIVPRPIDILEYQDKNLENIALRIHNAIWGGESNAVKKSLDKTAYEISVNEQSVYAKLDMKSKGADIVETEMTNYFGLFYLGAAYQGCNIVRSNQYNFQTKEEAFNNYQIAREKKVNSTILTQLYADYLSTAYERNPNEFRRDLKQLQIKPFFHNTPDELITWTWLNDIELCKNIYFEEFVMLMELTKPLFEYSTEELIIKLQEFGVRKAALLKQPVVNEIKPLI